jgi:hypothetical protein
VRLATLTAAALGDDRLTAQSAGSTLLTAGQVRQLIDGVADPGGDWAAQAARLGAGLLVHLRHGDPAPKEYPSLARLADAERASRTALPWQPLTVAEPARVAAAHRWQELLTGLAGRTARDHWYDEDQNPYWQAAANRYLADARRAVADGLPTVTDAPKPPADYPDARRLTLSPDGPTPIVWTSQRRRTVGFNLLTPADFPRDVSGLAVGWLGGGNSLLGWAGGAGRRLVPTATGGRIAGTLALAATVAEDTRDEVAPTGQAYFRGQRPAGTVRVAINRRPERVIVEPEPPRREAAVAVRANAGLPLGEVTLLLDYSGSMKQDVADGSLLDGRPWRPRDTKFKRAMASLREVLAVLPKGTPLRVRVFSDKVGGGTKAEQDRAPGRRVFPAGGRAVVSWESPNARAYKELTELLEGIEPWWFTPLVDQVRTAVAEDFTWTGPGAGLAKTLVLLTDGVDETEADQGADRVNRIRRRIPGLREALREVFEGDRGRRVGLFVVPFGQTPDDQGLCQELFAGIDRYPTPGRLFEPITADKNTRLTARLRDAVFPKLLLRDAADRSPPGLPRTGLASRLDARWREGPPYSKGNGGTDLLWSPWLPAGSYAAEASSGRGVGSDLTLSAADTVILGFAPDGRGGVRIRRELHADYFAQTADTTRRRAGDGRWHLTAPAPTVRNQALSRVAFVERTPPHRLPQPDDSPTDLKAAPPDPQGDGREVVWFDLLPPEGPPPPGKLTITRLYSYAAPAWKLEHDAWAVPGEASRVRATVAGRDDDPPEPHKLTLPLSRQQPETVTPVPGDEPLEVATSVEPVAADGKPQPGFRWLTLRITHPLGRPVFARLVDPGLPRAEAAHRYYPADGDRADYTATFRVPAEAVERLTEVRVNLARVGWALAAERRDRLAVTLDARPPADAGKVPRPIDPGASDDER